MSRRNRTASSKPAFPLAAACLLSFSACDDGASDKDQELTARINALTQEVDRINQHEARLAQLEETMVIAGNQINRIDDTLEPLPALVERAAKLSDEWAEGSLIVRIGSTYYGPLVGYFDTAIAFTRYRGRIVLASISPAGTLPFVGLLHFTGANCTGDTIVERTSTSQTFFEAALLDASSGILYESTQHNDGQPHTVLSRKNWYHTNCQNLSGPTSITGYAVTGASFSEPDAAVSVLLRYYANP